MSEWKYTVADGCMLLEQLSINKCVKKSTNKSVNQVNVLFYVCSQRGNFRPQKEEKRAYISIFH